ncbi:hypothetical protein, partial [Citrobacter freundii]
RTFSIHNREGHLHWSAACRDRFLFARVDWVMSPSPGDALFCCALKKAGGYRASGKTPGRQNRELLVIALACF